MEGNTIIRLKKIFSNPRTVIIAAVILFFPILFLGNHSSHDWGDDFAQYIHQAANIVHNIPQSETGFIYSQLNFIGPQAYPSGFPLILASVYAVAGNNITAFLLLISVLYITLGLVMIIYFRNYFSWITALILATIFIYNPQMVLFKGEVMSEIPFTVLLVICFILYEKTKSAKPLNFLVLALLTGFLIMVRSVGFIFVAAVILDQLIILRKRKISIKDFAIRDGIFITIPVLIYLLFNIFIFRMPSGSGISDYLSFFQSGKLVWMFPENFYHYIEAIRLLYLPQSGYLMGFSVVLSSVMLGLVLFGFLYRIFRGPQIIDWFFIFYIIMLLFFPDTNSASRLLIPLGFIFLIYSATGFKKLQLFPQLTAQNKAIIFGGLILLMFLPGIIKIARAGENIQEGPQKETAVEAFNFISKNVPTDSVVVFEKPRALALYGGCRSMVDPRTNNPTLFHLQVVKAKASYLLINNKLTGELMLRYSRVMQNRLTKQFENKDFVLYKINPVIR